MAIQINWDEIGCEVCPNPATHICIDEPDADDEVIVHFAFCDDCYAVRLAGTVWLHRESVEEEKL
jgi:hypothetical protein